MNCGVRFGPGKYLEMKSTIKSVRLSLKAAFCLLLASLTVLPVAVAQSISPLDSNSLIEQDLSLEQIQQSRKAIASDATLDETRKQKALSMYDQAAQWLQRAIDTKALFAQLKTRVRQAPQRIEEIRSGKARILKKGPEIDSVLASGSLDAIKLALSSEQLAMQHARDNQKKYEDELARLLVGSKGLSEEIAAQTEAMEKIERDLLTPLADEPSSLLQARTLTLQSRRILRQAELNRLTLRLGSHDLLTNLTQAERDLVSSEIVDRQKRLDSLSESTQRLSEAQARQASQEAEALQNKSKTLPALLQRIAEENARHRQELEKLISREQAIVGNLETAQLDLDEVKNDFERIRQRVEVVGPSEAMGKILKRRRQELPSLQSYRHNTAQRGAEIGRATDRQIDIEELLRDRGDIRSVVAITLDALPEADRSDFEQEITELARARRDALNELQKVYGRYIGQITSLDLAKRQLVDVSGAYVDYIDDQLVWIAGLSITALLNSTELFQDPPWLISIDNWNLVATDAVVALQKRTVWIGVVLMLFTLMLWNRRRSIRRLEVITGHIRKIRTDSFKYTLSALLHTLNIIGAWPLLMIAAGWLLRTITTAEPFSLAVADGLINAGVIFASVLFLIQICRKNGLGDRHLGWPQPIRESLAQALSWFLPAAVPLGFLVAVTAGIEPPPRVQLIGRVAFFALMAIVTLLIFRLLWRRSTLMTTLDDDNGGGPMRQLYFLWFPLLIILPVSFAIISAWGYHNTALHMEQHAEQTIGFFIVLVLLKELILRSLYIVERRLRFENAVRRRDELRAQRALEQEQGEEDIPLPTPDIPVINFDELSEQNKRLLRAGFLFGAVIGIWSIWGDLLPALTFLNTTELPIYASRIVDGIVKEVPVTLGDLTVGLIMVVITVLAAKNIPGVLEITLLQRLPLDAGARYAITSLTQYAIAGIGVLMAFSTLGLQWSSVQWLVAALSVGLGFGLQEIVANFISGIILLFERPIRVGDVVTIDNTTGKVSRIRIRATTIINWDKQELLIPNKAIITGQVINWTLSDKVNRIVVVIGIEYGSDVDKAMELMLQVARENEHVLDDPEPFVSFDAFGDNALTLTLRSYLGSMDNRLSTITELHRVINERFNAAGIGIPFPQRDIHLDTSRPLDIRVHPASDERAS